MTVLSPTDHCEARRPAAGAALHDLDGLCHAARAMRRDVLGELPELLERFADHILALGGHVCWASTANDARHYIARVIVRHNATQVLRSCRGMTAATNSTDEIAVDQVITSCRADVVETDLTAWIDRLTDQAPGHMVATAPHRERGRIRQLLAEQAGAAASSWRRPSKLERFAQGRLRDQFLGAEVGVGAAELAVADTGSVVVLTDQANAHLVTVLPPVYVVVVGIDQVAAGWDQADLLLALRAHAASPSPAPVFPTTTVLTGPRHLLDLDGPRELHVVVLDNGRSRRLADLAGDGSSHPHDPPPPYDDASLADGPIRRAGPVGPVGPVGPGDPLAGSRPAPSGGPIREHEAGGWA